MRHTKLLMEIDFAKRKGDICILCTRPRGEHFDDSQSDPGMGAPWCPNPCIPGGFQSRSFQMAKKREVVSL